MLPRVDVGMVDVLGRMDLNEATVEVEYIDKWFNISTLAFTGSVSLRGVEALIVGSSPYHGGFLISH